MVCLSYTTRDLLGVAAWSEGTVADFPERKPTTPLETPPADGRLKMEAVVMYLKRVGVTDPDSEEESEAGDMREREQLAAATRIVNPMLAHSSKRAEESE